MWFLVVAIAAAGFYGTDWDGIADKRYASQERARVLEIRAAVAAVRARREREMIRQLAGK